MTPKERAKELYLKMIIDFVDWTYFIPMNKTNTTIFSEAKQRALLTVDEILNIDNIKPYILHKEIIEFYKEVKQEIEKL